MKFSELPPILPSSESTSFLTGKSPVRGVMSAFFILLHCYVYAQPLQADWLTGTWKTETSRGVLFEDWKKISPDELNGRSYRLHGKDTVFIERIRLYYISGQLHYVPTVARQNNNLPVYFPLVESNDSLLIFENKSHDFPQRISYRKNSPTGILAEISGLVNNTVRIQKYPMKKVNLGTDTRKE